MSDPSNDKQSSESPSNKTLDETMPPMKLQQKSLSLSDLEPLDKTTAGMRDPSHGPPRRRP